MSELVKIPFEGPILWYALFLREKKWWSGKYSHVSLAGYADETWIMLDLHRSGVSVGVIHRHDEVIDFLSYAQAYHDIVKFGFVEARKSRFLRPMTCVSFVKHALGVRSGALRPDALFTSLIRDHSGVFINEAQDRRNSGAKA